MKAKSAGHDFPVVCVGGSAGGRDAYTRLLRHLPADMGVAVVIVNHLRTVATLLHEILPNYTEMPVELITERLLIAPNHVFIIPAQHDLHVLDGEFRLKPISKPRGWPDVITVFLRSLTQNWDGKLIAVIVSGYDGDGAAALCGMKEVGGITIAQNLETAGQPDMPESAPATTFWARIEAIMKRDAGSNVPLWRAVLIDIGALKRFTTAVSHDLKSRLATISTFLDLLELDICRHDVGDTDKSLAAIRKALNKMFRLLGELSNLLRVGHRTNLVVEAPLQEVMKEALGLALAK